MSTSSHWSISGMSAEYLLTLYFDGSQTDKLTISNFASTSTFFYLP